MINTRHTGNWGRKVNHSCEPNVQFVCRPVSGKWRIIFEVTQAIQPGDAVNIPQKISRPGAGQPFMKSVL